MIHISNIRQLCYVLSKRKTPIEELRIVMSDCQIIDKDTVILNDSKVLIDNAYAAQVIQQLLTSNEDLQNRLSITESDLAKCRSLLSRYTKSKLITILTKLLRL